MTSAVRAAAAICVLLAAGAARAGGIVSIVPSSALHVSQSAASFDIVADSDVARIDVAVAGQSPDGTSFVSIAAQSVARAAGSATPFVPTVAFAAPLPPGGTLTVTVTPYDGRGVAGPPAHATFSTVDAPSFGRSKAVATTATPSAVIVDVGVGAGVVGVRVSVLGISASALRTVSGSLDKAVPDAFAYTPTAFGVPHLGADRVSIAVPLVSGRTYPPDAIVILCCGYANCHCHWKPVTVMSSAGSLVVSVSVCVARRASTSSTITSSSGRAV